MNLPYEWLASYFPIQKDRKNENLCISFYLKKLILHIMLLSSYDPILAISANCALLNRTKYIKN